MDFLAIAAGLAFFGLLLLLLKLGQRTARSGGEGEASAGVVEGAIFALLSLLLGFSFSAAAGRFDTQRHVAVDEANAIGTAVLRLDLLPKDARAAARQEFKKYVELRLSYEDAVEGSGDTEDLWNRTTDLQGQIWRIAMAALPPAGAGPAQVSLLSSLNEVFDLAQSRRIASQTHAPTIIVVLLVSISFLSAFLAGRLLARSLAWYRVIYAFAITMTLFTIVDLDYPRFGFIRLDYVNEPLRTQLRDLETVTNP